MSRPLYLVSAVMAIMVGTKLHSKTFERYKPIEAYEVHPGVLAMPRYAEDGQVCEIGFEKRSYSPGLIRLGQSFSQNEIDHIVDDFAPSAERGRKLKGGTVGGVVQGMMYANEVVYENVTIVAYSGVSNVLTGNKPATTLVGIAAVTIDWTNRKCQPSPTGQAK